MPLFIADVILDLEDVFSLFFDDVSISIYCKEVMATISSTSLALKTSLVILVFLASLPLMSGKLVLTTKHVSRKSVSKLSPSKVFPLLFCRPVPLKTPGIYLLGAEKWLQQRFYFCIDGFLNGFFLRVQFLTSCIQLGPNKRF